MNILCTLVIGPADRPLPAAVKRRRDDAVQAAVDALTAPIGLLGRAEVVHSVRNGQHCVDISAPPGQHQQVLDLLQAAAPVSLQHREAHPALRGLSTRTLEWLLAVLRKAVARSQVPMGVAQEWLQAGELSNEEALLLKQLRRLPERRLSVVVGDEQFHLSLQAPNAKSYLQSSMHCRVRVRSVDRTGGADVDLLASNDPRLRMVRHSHQVRARCRQDWQVDHFYQAMRLGHALQLEAALVYSEGSKVVVLLEVIAVEPCTDSLDAACKTFASSLLAKPWQLPAPSSPALCADMASAVELPMEASPAPSPDLQPARGRHVRWADRGWAAALSALPDGATTMRSRMRSTR